MAALQQRCTCRLMRHCTSPAVLSSCQPAPACLPPSRPSPGSLPPTPVAGKRPGPTSTEQRAAQAERGQQAGGGALQEARHRGQVGTRKGGKCHLQRRSRLTACKPRMGGKRGRRSCGWCKAQRWLAAAAVHAGARTCAASPVTKAARQKATGTCWARRWGRQLALSRRAPPCVASGGVVCAAHRHDCAGCECAPVHGNARQP